VLARASSVLSIKHGCSIVVRFKIPTSLGRFAFFDKSNGDIWYGFNSRRLPRRAWRLTITEHDFH
jgi:hypothetical protein